MWEDIIIWLIIATAVFLIGRRIFRQWRAAFSPGADISCSCGCTGCGSICDNRKQPGSRN